MTNESPDIDGWSAAGATYSEVVDLAQEGIPFALGHDAELEHYVPASERIPALRAPPPRPSRPLRLPDELPDTHRTTRGEQVTRTEHTAKSASTPNPGRPATRRDWGRGARRRGALAILAPAALLAALLGATALPASALPGACPQNEAIRTEQHPTEPLPACRAYELVTPVAKHGWNVFTRDAGASHLFSTSFGAFAGSTQAGVAGLYDSGRTSNGWVTTPLNLPPGFPTSEGEPLFDVSSDSTAGAYELTTIDNPNALKLYTRPLPDGKLTEVGPLSPRGAFEQPELGRPSASASLGTIVFELPGPSSEFPAGDALWPGDHTAENTGSNHGLGTRPFFSVYQYSGTGNAEPELVGVSNQGSLQEAAAEQGKEHINETSDLISQCGTSLGFPQRGNFRFSGHTEDNYNVISADGSRVFFTAAAATEGPNEDACTEAGGGQGPSADELYVRIDRSQTLALSEPSLAVPGRECTALCLEDQNQENGHKRSAGIFQGASEDGSRVFFLTSQPLVNGDQDTAPDLYEAEIGAAEGHQALTRLVQVSHDPNPGEAADLQGVSRVSEDGSHVYFVAHGVLTTVPNSVGDAAHSGADNFYLYDTLTGHTAFIGDLCSGPEASGSVGDTHCSPTLNENGVNDLVDWLSEDSRPVDANACESGETNCEAGRFLVFTSYARLTPDDTAGSRQVFEYDAATENLARVSIGQHGFNDDGNAENQPATIVRQQYHESQDSMPQLTSVSADGSQVVFESNAALTPQAAPGYGNVYEYDAGQLSLISDGRDRSLTTGGFSTTSLIGMDRSGADVFFTSADRLVPQDLDTQEDVYDARSGGGFAPPPPPSECAAQHSCQAPPPPPSPFAVPASATLSGSGNYPFSKGRAHKGSHHRHHRKRADRAGHNRGGNR